jgi:hypothetical protein
MVYGALFSAVGVAVRPAARASGSPARRRSVILAALMLVGPATTGRAQSLALGAGVLSTRDFGVGVVELYVASPAVRGFDLYGIGSWQWDEPKPTVILALERAFFVPNRLVLAPAVGAIGFPSENYTPHFVTNVTVIALLPVERLTFTTVLATQPLDDCSWSIVTKVALVLWK